MDQDSVSVLEAAPAEAPPPRLTALAHRLRALDETLKKSRQRVVSHEESLRELNAQVAEFSGKFEILRERIEAAAVEVPEPAAPKPILEAAPETIPMPIAVPPPAPLKLRKMRMAGLFPYAILAACSLALVPHISFQSGSPVSAEALVRVPPSQPPAPDRSREAIALAISYKPEGSLRDFGQLLGPELDTAGPSAWEAQSVGNGVYLVSFRPRDVMGPQADYEFTVDVNARLVTPEPDTAGRLFAGR